MKKYDKVVIKSSTKAGKKMMATFSNSKGGRTKTIHFGAAGMDDYTRTRSKEQKSRYDELLELRRAFVTYWKENGMVWVGPRIEKKKDDGNNP